MSALGHLKVVDLGRIIAGPTVGQMLGDFGADVIKVEPAPDGDFLRSQNPSYADGMGSYFATANRNKRSLLLDLRGADGKRALRRLLAEADVLVENFRPGVLEEMGLDDEALARDFPRLVVARISAFGHVGPWRDRAGVDQLAQGMAGLMAVTGTPDTGPIRCGIAISDLMAGLCATIGVLTALVERDRSGSGQVVRTSLLEALLAMMSMQAGKYFATGTDPLPEGNHHPVIAPYGLFHTSDGHIQLQIMHDRQFAVLARLCDRPDWVDNPLFNSPGARSTNRVAVREAVQVALATRPTAHWVEVLLAADIPCGPVLTVAEAFAHPQAQALDMVLDMELADGTIVRAPGFPIKLSRTPPSLRRPPPLPGEHGQAILDALNEETN